MHQPTKMLDNENIKIFQVWIVITIIYLPDLAPSDIYLFQKEKFYWKTILIKWRGGGSILFIPLLQRRSTKYRQLTEAIYINKNTKKQLIFRICVATSIASSWDKPNLPSFNICFFLLFVFYNSHFLSVIFFFWDK